MSVEGNKAAVRRIIEEAMNKGNLAVVDGIVASNYVYHGPMGMEFKGPEGLKQMITMYRTAFPNIRAKIEDMVGEGDMVAGRSTMQGTFTGELMGFAPTGKKFTLTGTGIFRFAGGKEVEAWGSMDTLSFYQQLGIPIPASR